MVTNMQHVSEGSAELVMRNGGRVACMVRHNEPRGVLHAEVAEGDFVSIPYTAVRYARIHLNRDLTERSWRM